MKKILNSENGVILLLSAAVIVILVSSISTISLMGLVRYDNMQVQYCNDILQAETILRSERSRINIILKNYEESYNSSDHKIEIHSNGRYTTYSINNEKKFSSDTRRIGTSLINVRRGRKYETGSIEYDGIDYKTSPVKRYSETELSGKSLAQYQYYTMCEYSENDEYNENDYVKFWGDDELWGPIHSNTNIYIQNQSGPNPGPGPENWPLFHEFVTTNGRIMDYNGGNPVPAEESGAPMEEIFLGGYMEEAGFLNMSNGIAYDIRINGFQMEESHHRDIMFAKINGSSVEYIYADIETELDTFTVYNSFPDQVHPNFPVGDSIWVNYINVKKLDWDEESQYIEINNSSVMVYCQLWIEGNVGSAMTFGCSDTIFITNDLTYESISPGDPPDEDEGFRNILGLVSEKRIYIQYKNYDPLEEEINDDNCDDIYLYGSFAAIGEGDRALYGNMNTHYEGIFSFYYQHPHGSTEPFNIELPNGSVWEVEYPDFHKFIFPPSMWWNEDPGFQLHGNNPVDNNGFFTCGYPYEVANYYLDTVTPYGTDWPWYNPVWPEGSNSLMGERGDIIMFGGVQQFRRGFVHRSGTDPKNHHPDNEWDISHWLYDGTHGSTGYRKNYHWDGRIDEGLLPPDYPQVYEGLGNSQLYYSSTGWAMKAPPGN